ncbi:hypothetical protein MAM1_0005d00646 [Mucor ambiguus]|uniref:Uncharacterized protein n=1 Tax=Mucor ambiguus TaxID=91626 RepID=A0A0C9M4J1_9FUNG|nr:hypothetical protein MAM1_0005d00646 [Mucor ambiguus]
MGLLKLGSLYKKKSKKDTTLPPPPVPAPVPPKLEPISLELNLDLNNPSSIHDTNTIATATLPQQQRNIDNMPAGSGSLLDDIFSELTTAKPVAQQADAMHNDISLAVALSQQLQLEEKNSTNGMTGTTQKGSNTVLSSSSSNKNEASSSNVANFLLGGDSIYSSYLRNISALDHDPSTTTNSTFSTSMFDHLLGNSKQSTTSDTLTAAAAASNIRSANVPSTATKVVLDSDISDSDEDSKNDSEDDNTSQQLNYDGNQRMTRGVRPIMERRTQDNRLLVQRKIDNWANRVDPEANQVESNESMINRMKDRHRNQVKLAALRQQQQDQQQQQQQLAQYNMMPHHMVAQPYGPAAAIPLSPNVVLPHPGMLMDPAQMYYSTPINDYPETPGSHTQPTPPPPPPPTVPLPSGFLPNPSHATLAIPHKDKEDKNDQHMATVAVERPFPSQSYSTPTAGTSSGRPKPSRSPPAMPVAPPADMTPSSISSSVSSSHVNVNAVNSQTQEPSPASSSITLQSSLPTDAEDGPTDDKFALVESPVKEKDTQPSAIEDETMAAEADAESSDDEERKSVILRKRKSMKKLRQKQQQQQQQQQGSVDGSSDTNQRQIRSSRSAPNLKKKQSSKKMSKSTSRSSSRRNSQETCTPPSELISTPPPLPSNYEEEHHYHLPRSSSHQQMHQTSSSSPAPPLPHTQHHHYYQHAQQQNRQYQRQPLRHMKSEPDLPRRSQYLPAQQQQLNSEWERMQLHQREQQLKKQYLQGGHSNSLPAISTSHAQQPMPYMPMYASPVYYPSMPPPSMIPYSGSTGMDVYNTQPQPQPDTGAHRASMMSSYYQQPPPQSYYQPSHR